MKKFLTIVVLAFAVLSAGLYTLFSPVDMSDPHAVSEMILDEADALFPEDVKPADLVGKEVVLDRVKKRRRPYVSRLDTLLDGTPPIPLPRFFIGEDRDPFQHEVYNIVGRGYRGNVCEALHGGKLKAVAPVMMPGKVQETILAEYTPPPARDLEEIVRKMLPGVREIAMTRLAEEQCNPGTILEVTASQYQSLLRESYLRSNHDPKVERLIEEQLAREAQAHQDALDKALSSLQKNK